MLILVLGGSASGKSEYAEQRVMELCGKANTATEDKRAQAWPDTAEVGNSAQRLSDSAAENKRAQAWPDTAEVGNSAQRLSDSAAEDKRAQTLQPIYLATMINSGKSSKKRILRHQTLREGKGFQTIECPMHVERASVPSDSVVLLECLSNLLANEMFSGFGEGEETEHAASDATSADTSVGTDDGEETEHAVSDAASADTFVGTDNGEKSEHASEDGPHAETTATLSDRILASLLTLQKKTKHLVIVSNQIFSDGITYDEMSEAYRADLARLHAELSARADEVYEVVCGIPLCLKG